MPTKRYLIALLIIFTWATNFLYLNLKKIFAPDQGMELMQQIQSEHFSQSLQQSMAITSYIATSFFFLISCFIAFRLFQFIKGKSPLMVTPSEQASTSQKIGIFFLKSGYNLSALGLLLFILYALTADTGGLSGIPLVFVFCVGIFFLILSIPFIEFGNYKVNKSRQHAPSAQD